MKRETYIGGMGFKRIAALALAAITMSSIWMASAAFWDEGAVYGEEGEPDYSAAPNLTASSAVLIDMKSGKVLFEKEKDTPREPAGITKIMTTLLALENLQPADVLTVDEQTYSSDASGLYLLKDEEINVDNLLYSIMLPMENDAAAPIAKAVDGSVEAFVNRMNNRAAELDMLNTHFVNPNGNHVDGQQSTAYDLALLTREAMKNENFRRYASTHEYTLPASNKQKARLIRNANKLLYEDSQKVSVYGQKRSILCEGIIGVKTGYTAQAGNCIVAAVSRGGMDLIAVVLGSGSKMVYADALEMIEYGFHHYENMAVFTKGGKASEIPVTGGKADLVNAVFTEDVNAAVPIGTAPDTLDIRVTVPESIDAPVTAGAIVGKASAYLGEEKLGEVNLATETEVDKTEIRKLFNASGKVLSVVVKVVIGIAAVLVLWIVITLVRSERRKRSRRRRRMYKVNSGTREVKRIKRIKR
ncbi:MAG: D-alanyl-D-alanine carboxypeptidase [Clostridiales Family XIII bacterium]|jgi:D-alanyl-D-alanine carboxypeptidase (penicillin-binding protein 5/6)|nr:D-alanyl-D-alanine carboxypeptidase [Clostridiales Family XIII bacterium]